MKHELTPEVISQIVDFAKKYEPKGDLVGIPKEVISVMLQRQYEQNGKWDVEVFEHKRVAFKGGIDWDVTIEGLRFWDKTMGGSKKPDFTLFFTRYPERFEVEPQYKDSLGYPLEIGDDVYICDVSVKAAIKWGYRNTFKGMRSEQYTAGCEWRYAVSVKAYQANKAEIDARLGINQPEVKEEVKAPEKPSYVTPCGTFTEGEEVLTEDMYKCLFYRYDERLVYPYMFIHPSHASIYKEGGKFLLSASASISKIKPLPTIEEVASKAGLTVEQLKEVVNQSK